MIIREFKTKIGLIAPIVDVEICNDINTGDGYWDYESSDIVTFGVLYGNKATIIQREINDNVNNFKKKIKEKMDSFPLCYSFNFRMERGALFGFLGKRYVVEEIKPFKGKGWSKDKFFSVIEKIKKVEDKVFDPLGGDSSLVKEKYFSKNYNDIILHNLNCLIKEAYILKYKRDIIKKYKDNINDDGWFVEK